MNELFCFNLPKVKPDEVSPAVWAYVGDAVYELFVRLHLVAQGPAKTRKLHQEAVSRVRASYQAEILSLIQPLLTEEELEILRRGRNVKTGHVPNNTDIITYRHSTAFEALIGYLYLDGRYERLIELLKKTVEKSEDQSDAKS